MIIAGSKDDHPARMLEQFWLEVAETVTSSVVPDSLRAVVSSSYSAIYGNSKIFSLLGSVHQA
jgi:NTE family protein